MRSLILHLCVLTLITMVRGPAAADPGVIPCLSGFVRDSNGNPVANGDIDFFDVVTGVKLVTPGDNTDASGFYGVCVVPGVYRVTFAPPAGSHLMGKQVFDVDLTANVGKELDVTLDFGTVVSGTVRDAFGLTVADVDVDVDRLSGGRVFTPDDNTDVNGAYWVVIPDGDYRIRFEPPIGSRWRGVQIDSVTVVGDSIIDVRLQQGVLLDGRVSDIDGNGLHDIDIDLRTPVTGKKVFVANNSTDLSGDYVVAVPTGTFEVRFSPPRGNRYVGELIDSLTITGDQRLDRVLQSGLVLTAVVQDTAGNPVEKVDLDLKRQSTGEKIFTPNDNTDAQGTAIVSALPDVYTLQFEPPLGTTLDRVILTGVPLARDTTIVVQLPEAERVTASGTVTDGSGVGLPDVEIEARIRQTGTKVFIPNNRTDPGGGFTLEIPVGVYDILFAPPAGSRSVGRVIESVTVAADSAWGQIVLEDGLVLTANVVTETGTPVQGADLDVVAEATGNEIFTPHDNTNQAGVTMVAVPSDRYTIVVFPPDGSHLMRMTVTGLDIQRDTTVTFMLQRQQTATPSKGFALLQNYPNPFTVGTAIEYELLTPGEISLRVYNVAGQLVKVLESGFHSADRFQRVWDGTNQAGQRAAGGVYFYRLKTPQGTEAKKMLLVR